MKNQVIPVLLLTGYLGSGKTTLLNRILTNRQGIRFAVIVNDIGEVNIDASLIQKGGVVGKKDEGDLVALQNGCICCTLKMDLVEQLAEITATGKFDYIVIEASGICEPAPIAQTICSIPNMAAEYHRGGIPRLDCIATVVDALRLKSEFDCGDALGRKNLGEEDLERLVIEQIEFCNIILLNKISEVTPEEAGRIRAIIRAIQPRAEIIECDYCDIDFDKLLNTRLFNFEKTVTSATGLSRPDVPTASGCCSIQVSLTSSVWLLQPHGSTLSRGITTTMMTMSMSITTTMSIITDTTVRAAAVIITTTARVRPSNMASAHLCTIVVPGSTSTSSTALWHRSGRATLSAPKGCCISSITPICRTCSSRPVCRRSSPRPDTGLPLRPKTSFSA